MFGKSEIQNPQSAIEFLTPDPPAAEHLKPLINNSNAQNKLEGNVMGKRMDKAIKRYHDIQEKKIAWGAVSNILNASTVGAS
jgi:hypothetical protein